MATELPTSEESTVVDAENATTTAELGTGKDGLQVGQEDSGTVSKTENTTTADIRLTPDIESFSAQFGVQADYVRRNYIEGQDVQEYEVGFQAAYAMGRQGGKQESLNEKNIPYLSRSQREIAFELGQAAAKAQRAAQPQQAQTSEAPSLGKRAQLTAEDGSDGGEVAVSEIVSMDEDNITFRLEDGRTVTDDDLSFEDGGEIYSTLWELGMDAGSANAILRSTAGSGLSQAELAEGIAEAYRYGKYGYGEAALGTSQEASRLPEAVRKESYRAGEKQRQQTREIAQSREISKTDTAADKGKVHFDGDAEALNEVQRTSLKGLEWIAEVTGANIYVRDMSTPDGLWDKNGVYDPSDDSMLIDLRAGSDGTGTLLYTAAHEFVHRMKARSEAKFYRLADFLVAEYGKKGVSTDALVKQQMANTAAGGLDLSYDEAFEEMVADAMQAMFTDTDAMAKMEKLKHQDRNLWQEIKDFVLGLADKIKAAYARLKPDSAEARYVLQMKDSVDQLAQLFAEGVTDTGSEKNTAQADGAKYSLRKYSQHQKANWATSKRIIVYDNSMQLMQFIQDSVENKTMDKKMYFGAVSSELAERILIDTGLYVENYNLSLGSYEVRKILKDHGSEAKEAPRGQRAVSAADFAHIVDIVLNPASIVLSEEQYMGKPAIIFTGNHKGRMNVVAVVSDKRLDLFIQTIYVNVKKEGNLATPTGDQAPVNTPEANDGTVSSKTSIRNSESEVKKKFSHRDSRQKKTAEALEMENARLREDVSRLKELVKLQRKVTGGTKFQRSSVEAAARYLKKLFHTDGDTKELADKLNGLYEYIASDPELTWDGVQEQAAPIVDWLQEHEKFQRSQYAQEVLDALKGRSFYLDENQKQEAVSRYGSIANYRRAVKNMASNKTGQSLDQLWQELSTQYPDIFSPNTGSADMPLMFAGALDMLENMEDAETAMDWRMKDQSMLREVYDSYWRVSSLKTVADRNQKKVSELKGKHYAQMEKMRKDWEYAARAADKVHENAMKELRENQRNKLLELEKDKKAAVKKVRDNRDRAELRQKIRKTVKKLDSLLKSETREKHILDSMKKVVAEALTLLNDVELGTAERRMEALKAEIQGLEQKLEQARGLGDRELVADFQAQLDEKMLSMERYEKSGGRLATLRDAYDDIRNSADPDIAAGYDAEVAENLAELAESIKDTSFRDMSIEQLRDVYDMYTMVLTRIRDANKAFTDGRSIQADAEQLVQEAREKKIPKSSIGVAVKKLTDSVGWNYEKLHYALDRINSPTLTKLFAKLADSEQITMRDIQEAKAFQMKMVEKYHYNDWKIDKKIDQTFVDNTGKEFRLTLGELMALYAYSRREGADRHIEYGGFKLDKTALTDPAPVTTYKLTAEQCAKIAQTLTQEQRAFAEEMQKYLSETMGAKGNEISMKLYGIKMFGEKNYFPLHIAGEFKARAQESQAKAAAGFQSMTNAGFTKARNKNATAPIVLEDFMEVWADHVNEMSRYHGAVPALEDIRRVMNYSTYSDADNESVSVQAAMTNAYGEQAVRYFDALYREANSGAITDKLDAVPKKLLSLFRKNAVAYSLSVVIQQPASIYRARAVVDRKYFGKAGFLTLTSGGLRVFNRKKWNAAYAEMMQYAPGVTMAKEIGGFDTSTGGSIRSYLMDTEKSFWQSMKHDTLANKAGAVLRLADNNPIANLPNVADKIAWIEMWEASKRETVAKNPKLKPNSEEFLQKVGERFTEVIRATQVYDSMFSKSPMLKSKNLFVQSMVSFMNEPNTVANMAEAAIRDLTRGNVKKAGKAAAALVTSIAATNLLKSLVYAMRDDDEDETFLEKYVSAVAGNLIDDVTVFNYVPFVRDIWSVAQGYDVERADMAIVSDAVNAVGKLSKLSGQDVSDMTEEELLEWDREVTDASWAVAETLSPLFGIPLKNVRRDILAVLNTVNIVELDKNRESTSLSVRHAVENAVWQGSKTNADRLYEAMASGDTEYVKRLHSGYKTEESYHSTIRRALREHDSRIWEAAVAWNGDDMETYIRIAKEIRGENHFEQDDIVLAIRAEASAMEEKDTASSDKTYGYFTAEKFGVAIAQNNTHMADIIKQDLIDTVVANGKTQDEAKKSFQSTAKSQVKELFTAGTINRSKAAEILTKYGGKSKEDASALVSEWQYEQDHPELQGKITYTQFKRWESDGKSRGVSLDVFTRVAEYRDDGTSGSVKSQDEVKGYIESVASDSYTRHALWCCFYKESTSPYD